MTSGLKQAIAGLGIIIFGTGLLTASLIEDEALLSFASGCIAGTGLAMICNAKTEA